MLRKLRWISAPPVVVMSLILLAAPASAASLVTVAIQSPTAGATVFGSITVSGTASARNGINSVTVAVDTGAAQPATLGNGNQSWRYQLDTNALSNGNHTITARATDTRGRSASTGVTVTVNNTPPVISISSPQAGTLVVGSFAVSGTASSPAGVASVQVRVDAGTWTSSANTANWSVTIDSTAYADGGHAVSAMATDSVGHASTASVSVTFGNSPPSVSIASPQAGATVSGTLSVSGSSSSLAGIASVQVQVDANPAVTATGTTSWSATIDTTAFSNGGHAITATATDSKGRSTSTSVSVTVSNLLATHQNPWYLKDNTGNVSTVNETMTWDGDTNQNSKLPTGNVIFDVNSTIQPNDANSLDTCTQSASTGFWTCVHPIQAADLQWSFVLGWSLHYAFQLQVEYPPTSTFTISYSGDSNFFPSSAQAINT
jgi:hypothetical protein